MKKYHNPKHKIIFYVMSAAILVTILVTSIMFSGSVRSTDATQLDNMQNMASVNGTYPNEYTRYYAAELIEKQNPSDLDARIVKMVE